MFRSLFGGKKKRDESDASTESSLKSAGVGYTVVIAEFFSPIEDAYVVIDQVNRYDSAVGEWHELVGSDGERRVGIEWSFDGEYFVAVNVHGEPEGLDSIGVSDDDLIKMDNEHSLSNSITHNSEQYNYKNSYEAAYFKDGRGEGDGFYLWEFVSRDSKKIVSVVKWEDAPFEVYTSVVVPPESVTAYKV